MFLAVVSLRKFPVIFQAVKEYLDGRKYWMVLSAGWYASTGYVVQYGVSLDRRYGFIVPR